jgi:hypothetical protein
MRVPKMVKNGFNSDPRAGVTYWSPYSEWKSGTSTKAKMGIKTIFDQFRNSHARYPIATRHMLESIITVRSLLVTFED